MWWNTQNFQKFIKFLKKLKKKITNPLTNLLDKPNKKANKNKYYYNILLAFYYYDKLLYFEFDFEKTF